METTPAAERRLTTLNACGGGSQVFRLKFNADAVARIDRTRAIVRDKLGLKLSRAALLTLGLTTLLTNIAELQGIDVESVVRRAIRDMR